MCVRINQVQASNQKQGAISHITEGPVMAAMVDGQWRFD